MGLLVLKILIEIFMFYFLIILNNPQIVDHNESQTADFILNASLIFSLLQNNNFANKSIEHLS